MNKRRKETMDGNSAAAYVSYAFTEIASIYPITPSSQMAELVDEWSAKGKKNLFGQPVLVKEMQSEGGAAGTLHGALQGGALSSTYTASQGLLLMIPNMYKIAGELLPAVFHVSARSLASNALSIFGDHQDVMSTRQTGFSLLASSNVQQCMDMAAVAHLSAIESRIPFMHFFDGFRTSHEVQKIEVLEYDELAQLLNKDAVDSFRSRALNPDNPVLRGTTQNPDVFFQTREAVNKFYDRVPQIVENYMNKINAITGSDYKLFNYYGAPDAEYVIIAMGSGCDTIRETIEYANNNGEKFGLVEVRLYRPFSINHFIDAVPKSAKYISVLDRTKEPGSSGEPLYLDIRNAYFEKKDAPVIVGGRYGLASKDFTPNDVMAIYKNLKNEKPRNYFTVSIVDDVTFKSLPKYKEEIDTVPKTTKACKFWGLGSDGTVSANKSAIKIIGDNSDLNVQAYFEYDSKKSGGLTISHLRFGEEPIRSSYLVNNADYTACHNQSYVNQYDILAGAKYGSKFLLNSIWNADELEEHLPASLKYEIAHKNIDFYTINAVDIAGKIGLGRRINMIMQTAFFKLADILPLHEAITQLKKYVELSYGKQGNKVVEMNNKAIDLSCNSITHINVPESWKNAEHTKTHQVSNDMPDFVKDIAIPMNKQKGNDLPVSAFNGWEDGTYPTGLTQWEKRGISIKTPYWEKDNCIQCNHCSFVCPHAVLRPTLLSEEQIKNSPDSLDFVEARGYKGKYYTLGISALDCTGCGSCVIACPAKEKALSMEVLEPKKDDFVKSWEYVKDIESNDEVNQKQIATVKGSQFLRPLIEFSGACAGCGETPYAKLVTQLFGDRMMISNAAGCSTVWGGSAPGISYTKNNRGHGPVWGFSLFEDNAEYGYGMFLGANKVREGLRSKIEEAMEKTSNQQASNAMKEWLKGYESSINTRERADKLANGLSGCDEAICKEILKDKSYFIKRSNWVFGGDGWAYDIGYGGLDHVLASGDDINILVFDTEVYSNTGGQSSKATPTAAVAQFASSGKKTQKKDLGRMLMCYGYVYVAQIAMGADKAQTLKAIMEAEAYPGPSILIAYSPCVTHGIKGGMSQSQNEQKRAVEAGYWSLYRYNPQRKDEGLNPFVLDSKDPTGDFKEFLMGEVRFSALQKQFPHIADELFEKAESHAKERLDNYRRLSTMD